MDDPLVGDKGELVWCVAEEQERLALVDVVEVALLAQGDEVLPAVVAVEHLHDDVVQRAQLPVAHGVGAAPAVAAVDGIPLRVGGAHLGQPLQPEVDAQRVQKALG